MMMMIMMTIIITTILFYSAVKCHHGRAIARGHSVHALNTVRRQVAADLWTMLTGLSHRQALCRHTVKLYPPSPFIIITQPESLKYIRVATLASRVCDHTDSLYMLFIRFAVFNFLYAFGSRTDINA